jgi:hypothetical protein
MIQSLFPFKNFSAFPTITIIHFKIKLVHFKTTIFALLFFNHLKKPVPVEKPGKCGIGWDPAPILFSRPPQNI